MVNKDSYQCEYSVAATAKQIEIIRTNMPMLCNKRRRMLKVLSSRNSGWKRYRVYADREENNQQGGTMEKEI